MDIDINKIIDNKAKSAGYDFAKELSNYIEKAKNNKSKNGKDNEDINMINNNVKSKPITADMKAKYQIESRKIIGQYGDLFQIKNGEEYHFKTDTEYPEYIESSNLKDGYYTKINGNLQYSKELTDTINSGLENLNKSLVKEENDFLNSCRRDGEEYTVDEIGDDEKYLYLTRNSDGQEFQEYNISNELYDSLLKDTKDKLIIKYQNGRYIKED